MKVAISVTMLAIWVLLAVACSSGPGADPRKLVPANATLIGEVRVAKLLQDRDLAKLYDAAPKRPGYPQSFQELLAKGSDEAGMDLGAIKAAVFFGDAEAQDFSGGAILEGEFSQAGLSAALRKSSSNLTETHYKDRQVYVSKDGGDSHAYTLLNRKLLAVGTPGAVHWVIDVHRGDRAPVSGRVWETFQSLGSPTFRMAAAMPKDALAKSDSALNGLPGLGGMPLGLEALESLQVLGLALDKTDHNLKLHARLDFRDAESADRMEAMLSGGLSLVRGFSNDPQLRDVLDQVQVKVAGSRIQVLLRVTVAELQALASKKGGPL